MRNVFGFDTDHTITHDNKLGHLGLKVNLASRTENGVTHILNDSRQLISTNMRMSVSQDIRRGTMLAEYIENLLYRATLLTACIELAIRIGTCSTLAKAVIALCINLLCLCDLGQILLTFMDILTTFQHNRTQA